MWLVDLPHSGQRRAGGKEPERGALPPSPCCGCWVLGRAGSLQEPLVSVTMSHREPAKEVWGKSFSPPITPWNSEWNGGRRQITSKTHPGAMQAGITHFPWPFLPTGRPLLGGLCPWDLEPWLWAWAASVVALGAPCMPSERAGQWLWRGPPANLVTALLWQLSSSSRKNAQKTGASSGLQTGESGAACHRFCVANLTMTGVETLRCRSVYEDQPRASVLSSWQYLPTAVFRSSFFPVFHFFKLNNSRPFTFTTEHNHQEISQGEKKKIIILLIRNQQTRTSLSREFLNI